MKKLFLCALSLAITLICFDSMAQNHKKIVHKKGKNKVTLVHKGPKGKKVVVAKKPRKRVKRTRVVHHHYKHLPSRGALVSSMNKNAIVVNFGGFGYRYYSGVWYKPRGKRWMVVRSPFGVRVKVLPNGYRRCIVGSRTYYYYYGTYYVQSNKEYEVVQAPIGAEVGSLPDGYNTLTVNGEIYYELDGIYYMPSINENNEEILVVVNKPI